MRVGDSISSQGIIENGTPQGSVISPVLFIILINDMFSKVDRSIRRSLFADDGALSFRGRNNKFIMGEMQKAVDEVEKCSYKWGFKLSVEKSQTIIFSNKKVDNEWKLRIYNKEMARVASVRFLGVWLETRLTWNQH